MNQSTKLWICNAVRDITIAKMSDSTVPVSKEGGIQVADFMEEIYNKLCEITSNDDKSNH